MTSKLSNCSLQDEVWKETLYFDLFHGLVFTGSSCTLLATYMIATKLIFGLVVHLNQNHNHVWHCSYQGYIHTLYCHPSNYTDILLWVLVINLEVEEKTTGYNQDLVTVVHLSLTEYHVIQKNHIGLHDHLPGNYIHCLPWVLIMNGNMILISSWVGVLPSKSNAILLTSILPVSGVHAWLPLR